MNRLNRDVRTPARATTESDSELLGRFVAGSDEGALEQLVERYLSLVFGTALRRTGDHPLAEEVAQNVFILLARKAPQLQQHPTLGGWLMKAAKFESIRANEKERTRRRQMKKFRETQDGFEPPFVVTGSEADACWLKALPILDEALGALSGSDRDAIVLRFYQNKSFEAIGRLLGKSDDACQKQTSRALQKLGRFMQRRGASVPAAALAAGLTAEFSKAAPASLVSSVASSALSGSTAVGAASGSIFPSTTLGIMTSINTKTTFALSITALLAALATGGYLVGRSEAKSSSGLNGKGGTTGGGLPGSTGGGAVAKVGRADGTRPDKAKLIGEIIRQAREELQRADWDPHARHRAVWRISRILPEDIPIALGLVGKMTGGHDQESVLTDALLEHWAKTDGRAACEFSLRHRNHGPMIMLSPVREPLSAWATVDPQGALDWLVGESPSGNDGLVLKERAQRVPISNVRWIFGSWAHVDLDGAIEAFSRLEDPTQIAGALVGFNEGAGPVSGRMKLLDFLSDAPNVREKMRIVNVVNNWATHRPEELAEWIDGESGMRMEKMYRGYFQQELLHAWLGQDPGAAAEWWLSRETGGRRDLQIKELVEKWANVDLFGAAEWLASQTLDKQMDRSVWILAERMTDTDPERAFTWAASIKEDWIRERAMSRVLSRCVRKDRTAAKAAVRGADLPEKERARLLEQMKNGEVTQ